jgi:hypothetical protein
MSDDRAVTPENPSSPTLLPSERGEGSTKPPLLSSTGEGVGGEGKRRERVGGEGDPWREALPAIADRLREIGYDIASSQSGAPPGGSIVARRDLGDRAVVLAIDAGGRFRAEINWVVGEWPSRNEITGVPVQVVDAVSRTVTVTGQMSGPEQVIAVVRGLGTIASWDGVVGSEARPPPS